MFELMWKFIGRHLMFPFRCVTVLIWFDFYFLCKQPYELHEGKKYIHRWSIEHVTDLQQTFDVELSINLFNFILFYWSVVRLFFYDFTLSNAFQRKNSHLMSNRLSVLEFYCVMLLKLIWPIQEAFTSFVFFSSTSFTVFFIVMSTDQWIAIINVNQFYEFLHKNVENT